MNETLRKRVLRRLETLPEAQLYQVLDYIEFLGSKFGTRAPEDVSSLQTLAERLEDGLRKRAFSPAALREAFQLIETADRVLGSVRDAGREILAELQAAPGTPPGTSPSPASPRIGGPESSSGGGHDRRPPPLVDTPEGPQ